MAKQEVPVFLITGFLESGKTNFLNATIGEDYFSIDGKTLLLICEEGEDEYENDMLEWNRTIPVIVDSREELTPDYMEELREQYQAERVIIEWNGMWNPLELELPEGWFIHQQLMMVDGSTFGTYYSNMRSIFANMVRNSEVVICNRCTTDMDLAGMKRIFKSINPAAEVVFEDEEGELDNFSEEDLPFDVNAPIIEISNQDYGIWFLDASENPDRYAGKRVRFTAMVHKQRRMPSDCFIPGRMAMTCCEDDMVFLGYLCRTPEASKWKAKQWVTLTARVEKEFVKAYGEEGPVLYAEKMEPAQPITQVVQFG
ncbi:MAG: GTP-binding protein [Clostridiales bacterium]|nr:GTP-binding protein [Clostridiales bacterium]